MTKYLIGGSVKNPEVFLWKKHNLEKVSTPSWEGKIVKNDCKINLLFEGKIVKNDCEINLWFDNFGSMLFCQEDGEMNNDVIVNYIGSIIDCDIDAKVLTKKNKDEFVRFNWFY